MLIRHHSHHYFSYFLCLLCIASAYMYGYINSIEFLSLLVKQLGPWIGSVSVATTKCTVEMAWAANGPNFGHAAEVERAGR